MFGYSRGLKSALGVFPKRRRPTETLRRRRRADVARRVIRGGAREDVTVARPMNRFQVPSETLFK